MGITTLHNQLYDAQIIEKKVDFDIRIHMYDCHLSASVTVQRTEITHAHPRRGIYEVDIFLCWTL